MLEHFHFYPVHKGSEGGFPKQKPFRTDPVLHLKGPTSNDALVRALEPEVAVDMLLSNRLSFFEDPESLSAQSWDRFMTRSRCQKPGLWRLPDSVMSGGEERLKLTPTQIVRRTRQAFQGGARGMRKSPRARWRRG
jgi:hypothetical protein